MTPTATRKLCQTAKEVLSGLSARPTAHRGDCRDRARAPLADGVEPSSAARILACFVEGLRVVGKTAPTRITSGPRNAKGRPGRRPQIAKVREAAEALAGRASLRAGGYGLA
jgi:hypothetical protein